MALSLAQSPVQLALGTVTSGSNITATLGSTPTVGNLLVATLAASTTTAPTLQSGWTAITGTSTGAAEIYSAYRVVQSGDTTTTTPWKSAATASYQMTVYEVTGFGTFNAASDLTYTLGTPSGTTTTATMTAGNAGGLALFLAANAVTGSKTFSSTPSGFTLAFSSTLSPSPWSGYITGLSALQVVSASLTYNTGIPISLGIMLSPGSAMSTSATDTLPTESDSAAFTIGRAMGATDTAATINDAPSFFPARSTATGLYGRHFWRIVILDRNGNLVDIPQDDVEAWQVQTQLNGGYGPGYVQFVRDFDAVGALGYGYQVMIWFWPEGTARPANPYYSGTIIDELDQEQLDARGRVTASLKGDMSLLDAAVVDSLVTGGIGGTVPMPDAAIYLGVMVPNYQPPGFLTPSIPGSMFQLEPVQFSGTSLGQAIDTVVKMSTDSGVLWTWFVETNAQGQRRVVVQLDQNPNSVAGATFAYQFPGVTCDQYKISTRYRDIINVVTIYGGNDPTTGQQVFVSVEDGDSVTEFGPWEQVLNVPWLISNAAATSYAEQWLTLHGTPDAQGSFRCLIPDPTITAGKWVQINETPASSTEEAVIKQVRVTQTTVTCQKDRIELVAYTTSPTPYLDNALYRLGLNVNVQAATQIRPLARNTQSQYIVSGGSVSEASSSPAKINIAPCDAVFNLASQGIVRQTIAAAVNLAVADTITSATGDGDYTVWAYFEQGAYPPGSGYAVVKGPGPASSGNPEITWYSQLLAYVAVIDGIPYITDGRTLIAEPGISSSSTVSVASHSFGSPLNSGAGAYDQPLSLQLGSDTGTTQDPASSKLQIGWVAAGGSTSAVSPSGAEVPTNSTGTYSVTIPGIGAGAAVDVYARAVDTHDRASGWTYVGTTSAPTSTHFTATGIWPAGTSMPGFLAGNGAPTMSAPNGTFYSRFDGTTGSRWYVNTSGASTIGTTWTAVAGI